VFNGIKDSMIENDPMEAALDEQPQLHAGAVG